MWGAHSTERAAEWAFGWLDDFEEEQDEDDGKDEGESAAAVVAESWSHAIAAKAE